MTFDCPHCGQNLDAEEDMAGLLLDCPACSKEISVPKKRLRLRNQRLRSQSESTFAPAPSRPAVPELVGGPARHSPAWKAACWFIVFLGVWALVVSPVVDSTPLLLFGATALLIGLWLHPFRFCLGITMRKRRAREAVLGRIQSEAELRPGPWNYSSAGRATRLRLGRLDSEVGQRYPTAHVSVHSAWASPMYSVPMFSGIRKVVFRADELHLLAPRGPSFAGPLCAALLINVGSLLFLKSGGRFGLFVGLGGAALIWIFWAILTRNKERGWTTQAVITSKNIRSVRCSFNWAKIRFGCGARPFQRSVRFFVPTTFCEEFFRKFNSEFPGVLPAEYQIANIRGDGCSPNALVDGERKVESLLQTARQKQILVGISVAVLLVVWTVVGILNSRKDGDVLVENVVPKTRPATRMDVDWSGGTRMNLDLGGGVRIELVWIKPGSFMMGSPPSEDARNEPETQRRVTLTKGFWMGKYEVTQGQYRHVMRENPSKCKGDRNPVECLSWDDANEFCETVSRKTGKRVRLPTEAEWEYACRAGTATRYNTGDSESDLSAAGWWAGNSGTVRFTIPPRDTGIRRRPVGQKEPNAWGLYDMHGNVREWCEDYWAKDYSEGGATNPRGPASGVNRVIRGGSTACSADFCRAAYRSWMMPDIRFTNNGLRIALYPSQ